MTLVKLALQAYTDPTFQTTSGSTYSVFLNPESLSHQSENTYDTPHPPGSPGDTPRFNYASQGKVSFTLVLDGTRSIDGTSIEVSHEIATLRNTVFAYQSALHSPPYVKLSWGSFLFFGRLATFNVTYTMFRPSGDPLRAKVELAFVSFTDAYTLALLASNESADLSHHYRVQAGDTLPLLCHRIYGSARYYLQVARRNGLVHFSRLVPGQLLHFPPLS